MSEYFRKYIKKDHYPLHLYSIYLFLVTKSNLRHFLLTAFNNHSQIDNISKLKMTIGTFIGARNNSYLKRSIKFVCSQNAKSTISETFMKSAGKICYRKTSNGLKKLCKSKANNNKPLHIVFFH